jgi:signal transduction histidine kinase
MTMALASGLMLCNYVMERRATLSHLSEDFIQLVTLMARDMEELIGRSRQFLLALSRAVELQAMDEGACSRFLESLIVEYSRYRNLGVLDAHGHLVCSALPIQAPAAFAREPWFRHSIRERDFAMATCQMESEAEAGIAISYPLFEPSGDVKGLVFSIVALSHFSRPLANLQPARQFELMMIDRRGNTVGCYSIHEDCHAEPMLQSTILRAISKEGRGTVEVKDSKRMNTLYAFTPLSSQVDIGLFVVVGTPTESLYRNANRMLLYQSAGLWVITVLALAAVWLGGSALVIKPVRAMVAMSGKISQRKMDARTGSSYESGELGVLAQALDTMAESLEDHARQVQEYESQLRSLAFELSKVEERERRLLAADLHDRLGQLLGVSKIKLGMLCRVHPQSEWPKLIEQIRGYVDQAISETRSLTFQISPPVLYELGLEAALEYLAENVQKMHGINVRYSDDRIPKPLDHDLRAFLFRAANELLHNAVKHAGARHILMGTRREEEYILLWVEDNGVGFGPASSSRFGPGKEGFGLFSIRERLSHMGGEVTIESRPGQGTRVTLKAPLLPTHAIEDASAP